MDSEVDWRGVGHGWRFWRPVPSSTRPGRGQWGSHDPRSVGTTCSGDQDFRIDAIEQTGERVAVAFSLTESDGARRDFGQLLTPRRGRIIEMRDYRSGAAAHGAL